jgi:hypothetical protein
MASPIGLRLVALADGLDDRGEVGPPRRVWLDPERSVAPSPRRLARMLENAERLAPRDGGRWREFEQRVITNPHRDAARRLLETGDTRIPPCLKLEGATHADCLIETAGAVIWIEGKRNDWLAPAITPFGTNSPATPRPRTWSPPRYANDPSSLSATSTRSSITSRRCSTATAPAHGAPAGRISTRRCAAA